MKTIRIIIMSIIALFLMSSLAAAQQDMEGGKDHPMLSRMPGYYIESYTLSEFDSHEFTVPDAKDTWKQVSVEGKKTYLSYYPKEGAKQPSSLQIVRNFTNALGKIGGKTLYENTDPGNRIATVKVAKDGKEVWVEVTAGNGDWYTLTIIEKAGMKQEISANDLLDALNRDGHVALYINFDTGKSTIKPDSQKIINQIVEMMKNSPSLKLSIEGHTDNVGNPKSNKTLSEDRAKAVVAAIVKQGIDAKRLSSAGFGQDKPVADNKTEDGKAKNRRVELVKK